MPPTRVFVISGPSGAGKSSIINAVLEQRPAMRLSVSMTTRAPRAGEQNGREYHFVDAPTFEQMIANGLFLEWARNYDNYYGTSQPHIEEILQGGHHALLDVDTQGALNMQQHYSGVCYLFITPPSLPVLEERLRGRGTESEEVIAKRMARAAQEIELSSHYDHIIMNGTLEQAIKDTLRVIDTEVENDVPFKRIA